MAWSDCPHLISNQHQCLDRSTFQPEAKSHDFEQTQAAHCSGMQKPNQQTQEVKNTAIPVASFRGSFSAVVDRHKECSHCVIHSPSEENSQSRTTGRTLVSDRLIQAGAFDVTDLAVSPRSQFVIHQHGPPGKTSPRYILNATFRI